MFPLAVGRAWRYSRTLDGQREKITTQLDARVAGWDGLRVGDTTLGAFRIEIIETDAAVRYSGVLHWTVWFAPDAKCVAKWELAGGMVRVSARSAELVEFRPGR